MCSVKDFGWISHVYLYESGRFGLLCMMASIFSITAGVSKGITSMAFMFSWICHAGKAEQFYETVFNFRAKIWQMLYLAAIKYTIYQILAYGYFWLMCWLFDWVITTLSFSNSLKTRKFIFSNSKIKIHEKRRYNIWKPYPMEHKIEHIKRHF